MRLPPPSRYAPVVRMLSRFVRRELTDKQIPACSIALVEGDDVFWADGFGLADPAAGRPATAETLYRVGSVSKLFTGIAVLQLVERGRLELDAPVRRYLPSFAPENPFGVEPTLRHLLAHRSGLVREPPVGHYFDLDGAPLAAAVDSLNRSRLVYPPGSRVKYSNAGAAVAGRVVEAVTGEPFAERVRRTVLAPLGMRRSGFTDPSGPGAGLATGFLWRYDGHTFEAPSPLLGIGPAANLSATVLDLGRFVRALWTSELLAAETLAEMQSPQPAIPGEASGFGLGCVLSHAGGFRRVHHGGLLYGHAACLSALPDVRLGVVVAATMDAVNPVLDRIAEYALALLLAAREEHPLPDPEPTLPVDPALARRLEGVYAGAGGRRVDLAEEQGRAVLFDGALRCRLRAAGPALVVDDRLGFGRRLEPEGERLRLDGETLRRVPDAEPPHAPAAWRGLVGEYGWPHNLLYVLEHGQRLHALIEWFFYYPLEEAGEDLFRFPDEGLYAGETLRFRRDAQGRATSASLDGVVFPRRSDEPPEGEPFRIAPLRPVDELRRTALAAAPPEEPGPFLLPDLVELARLDPTIRLDVRYACEDNFLGTVCYEAPRVFLQRPAAEALVRAQERFRQLGFGLVVYDGYRPWHVTRLFWDATPEAQRLFVADPGLGSRHNRGTAVDVTLADPETGAPVEMPSRYDEFTHRALSGYPGGTERARWHRALLRRTMAEHGFTVNPDEWWHFDFHHGRSYPIMNVTFADL